MISIAAVSYAFSRVEWPGRNLVFFLMLSTMMIPPQALIVPQYVFFNKLDWIGTFNPIIIPGYFAGGAAMVFLLRQSMAQIPKELDESAFVDGANHIQIWWEIVMPLVKAPLATVATFLFVGFWNSLLTPLMYLQTVDLYTLPVYVSTLYNINNTVQQWPTIMTAAVLTTIPLIIIFFFAQTFHPGERGGFGLERLDWIQVIRSVKDSCSLSMGRKLPPRSSWMRSTGTAHPESRSSAARILAPPPRSGL